MPFFQGATDFEINNGHFLDASATHKTKKVTRIDNQGGVIGAWAQEGTIAIDRDIQLNSGPPPKVSAALPLGPEGANNDIRIGVHEASGQMLRALAIAILELQGPAQALLQALEGQNTEQIPVPAPHPSAALPNGGTDTISSAAVGLTTMIHTNLQAAYASAPSIPCVPTPSLTPSSETGTSTSTSTSSSQGSKKRRSLFGRFSKK